MPKNKIPTHNKETSEKLFVTWNDERSKALAFETACKAIAKVEPIQRSYGVSVYGGDYEAGLSVRTSHTRKDYESHRPDEALPTEPQDIIKAGMKAYKYNPIVRNIIDLMGDFACKGIELIHPNPKIQKFFRDWAKQVGFYDRSERFLNLLYRTANVVIKRSTVKLTLGDAENLERTQGKPDIEINREKKIDKREIPWKYTFLNPITLEVLGDELAVFAGEVLYGIKVRDALAKRIAKPRSAIDRKLVATLPADIVELMKRGGRVIPLDPEKVDTYYYKKDDWQIWAEPFTFPIYRKIILLDKMETADFAALDGAISHIRLWKLGDLEKQILPTEAGVARLAEMLIHNVAGGAMDLIWGPELSVEDITSEAYKFLGSEKYAPVLNAIYAGLGVPPTLTGSDTASGFTNNFISLKTLTERLSYGRQVLVTFWENEIRRIQKAMGFRFPAQIRFDRMSLTDDAAEKALLLQLVDRDIISVETVLERFGEIPGLEVSRLRKEYRAREKGYLPEKASPWHNPEHMEGLEKILLQQGMVTPSELGLELEERKEGERTALDIKSDALKNRGVPSNQPKGRPGQGRPKNSKDSEKRKRKRVVPRTAASFMTAFAWARKAQASISKLVTPIYLESLGKKDPRALSNEETNNLEEFKHAFLCSLSMETPVTVETLEVAVSKPLSVPKPCDVLYKAMVKEYVNTFYHEPPMEEQRQMKAAVYALYKGDF